MSFIYLVVLRSAFLGVLRERLALKKHLTKGMTLRCYG